MKSKNTDTNTNYDGSLLNSCHLTEQSVLNNARESTELESEDRKKTKSLHRNRKILDSHIECLKKYLNENNLIGPTEANRRLDKETGLKVSTTSVYKALIKLRKEIGLEYVKLSSSSSVSDVKRKPYCNRRKLNGSHIECLKKYLKENIYVGNTEARNRLREETGLEVSVSCIREALIGLEKEINKIDIELSLPDSATKIRSKKGSYDFKLKDSHMVYLRKYLMEDISIGNKAALNRLQEETGLKVSVTPIRIALIELREQINLEKTVIPSSISDSKAKIKPWNHSNKFKDSHIECLKKYLKEDIYIGSSKARKKLHEETGLEVSIPTVRIALIALRKVVDKEGNQFSLSPESKVRSRKMDYGYKLKDLHIEYLKKYLIENSSIGPTEARNRLREETGLELSISPVRTALIKLKGEMDPEQLKLHSSISGIVYKGYKLKNLHIECLKKYLIENDLIGSTEANNRLREETGLKVRITTIGNVLAMLRGKN